MTEAELHHDPVLVRASEAEKLRRDPSSEITLFADASATAGAVTCNRSTFKVGSGGAPSHFHTSCSEMFFVIGGSLDVLLGEEIVTLTAGDCLVVPPLMPHAFAPTRDCEADVLVVFTPGVERFDYYRLLDRVFAGDADPNEIGASQDLYDNHYVESDAWKARNAA